MEETTKVDASAKELSEKDNISFWKFVKKLTKIDLL